ncbi:hypothetical protein SCALM49S_02323 [Streptomyces californicus]
MPSSAVNESRSGWRMSFWSKAVSASTYESRGLSHPFSAKNGSSKLLMVATSY